MSAPSGSTYNPSTRPEQIDTLIAGVDRYNPHNLPLLHDYLDAQLKAEYPWDCMAALAVLKLYQFNPSTFSYETVTLMLAKSLHALPSPHLNLCLSLLGEAPVDILPPNAPTAEDGEANAANPNPTPADAAAAAAQASSSSTSAPAASTSQVPSAGILTDATIVKLHHLSTLLSSSRYPTFWTTLRSSDYSDLRSDVLDRLADFDDGVRRVVLNGTASAFRTISKKRLASYLGVEEGETEEVLKRLVDGAWTVRGDGVVEVPANADNDLVGKVGGSAASGVQREDVGLADLNRLLQQAAPSTPAPAPVKAA